MVSMGNHIENCRCGSRDVDVQWIKMKTGMFGSFTYSMEYYVECNSCGYVGEPSQSFDSAIRNWNEDCTNIR